MFKIILPKLNLHIERWKWNKEYRVYVSNLGHFKDEYKRELPIKINATTGYCWVNTFLGYKLCHRLVLLTWKPVPDAENLTVDHLNHNKRENTIFNLEWVTKEENLKRAQRDIIHIKEGEEEVTSQYDFIITYGKNKKFTSFEDAAFFMINKHMTNSTDIKKIKRKILNAIAHKQKYCHYYWTISFGDIERRV